MSTARSVFIALTLAAMPAKQIAAQRVPEIIDEALRIGSHVRVSTITGKTYVGTVARFSADTIALNVQGAIGALPTAAIKRLQLRATRRSGHTAGAVLGGLIGGASLYTLEHNSEKNCNCTRKAPARIGATIGGTAVGIALGAILGGAIHRDRWRDIALPHQ